MNLTHLEQLLDTETTARRVSSEKSAIAEAARVEADQAENAAIDAHRAVIAHINELTAPTTTEAHPA